MELPFYHDDSFLLGYNDLKAQKQPMNMPEPFRNLNHGPSLKLASPELERLISAQNSLGVLTSPTPTQCQYGSRAGVTDEQEGFAEGFVKALDELHKINHVPPPNVSIGAGAVTSAAAAFASSLQPEPPCYTTLSSYCPAPGYLLPRGDTLDQRFANEEPQIVPDMHSSDGSPPVSPIDMENQERIKAERKRLRNRLAATKCRKRKLERIARLEDKVKVLKSDNAGLSSAASALREQVAQLKQKVMRHVNSGCQLMLTSKTEAF